MNKFERMAVVVLFAALIGWTFFAKKPTRQAPTQSVPDTAGQLDTGQEETTPKVMPDTMGEATGKSAATDEPETEEKQEAVPEKPEQIVMLTNDVVRVAISSWGGAVKSVELSEYRAELDKNSPPLQLDFSSAPALSLKGVKGLGASTDFDIELSHDDSSVKITRTTPEGLVFERTITATNGYNLTVTDTLLNKDETIRVVPDYAVVLGPMQNVQSSSKMRGGATLGVDALVAGPEGDVTHWEKKIPKELFGVQGGCSKPNVFGMPMKASKRLGTSLTWVAAKNKFFVEILEPEGGCIDATLHAARDSAASNTFSIANASADLHFSEKALEPGEAYTRRMAYYVGPKKYWLLRGLGNSKAEVMQFGFFRPVCKILLPLLNAIHSVLPNYGVAIILLTIIVKIVFWPVTHKGTESMKKMQTIQPEVKQLREKYKDNPKKLQQEQMLLYKKHGVNPLAGCLPMVIQIPVFIALFTVLRSAVELRFAPFLWIRDLSEPEGLFAGMIPVVGSLNILPLLMAGTMVLQQRLTPSAGDPQQQKMMMFMPVMMLFIFYSMPSALVLYWTVSQGLSILQLVMQQRKSEDGKTAR